MPQLEDTLVTLLDPDADRRAAVASVLSPFVKRVVPRAQLDQLMANWPLTGIILVHGSCGLVADMQDAMRSRGKWRTHIVYAEELSKSPVVDAVLGGAIDYLDWPIGQGDLLERMQLWPSRSGPSGMRELRKIRARKRLESLTPRQLQVLTLIAVGKRGPQIAKELKLSERTLEVHRANILKRLGVSNNAAAIRLKVESEL
jgi:two-component system response regulator FixJ